MSPVSTFFSWHDAPDDPAQQALYRINQLENRFIQHVYENNIRQEFLLNVLNTLVDNKKIAKKDIEQAVNALLTTHQQHLKAEGDGTTMEQDSINDIIDDLKQRNLLT